MDVATVSEVNMYEAVVGTPHVNRRCQNSSGHPYTEKWPANRMYLLPPGTGWRAGWEK